MGGFSAEWLAMREGADHRARNPEVAAALRAAFAGRAGPRCVDIGCGTGSNVRALAPLLPPGQGWTLVDRDPALLAAATAALGTGHAAREADLGGDLEAAMGGGIDLATASALFDLVSAPFVERFAAAVSRRGAAAMVALTYDGAMAWDPAHPDDEAVRAAFNADQRRDKGFGPALGPDAAEAVEAVFRRAGYRVVAGPSPWRLGPGEPALIRALRDGVADAAGAALGTAAVAAWRAAPCAGAVVGHRDMLALPPAS